MTLIAVGTFTDGFMGGALGEGVHVFRLGANGQVGVLCSVVGGLCSPSYLACHPSLPLIYAAERAWSVEDRSTGALTTLATRPDGTLSIMDRRRSGGAFCAHVAVSPDGRSAALANPMGPTIALFPLRADGLPEDPTCAEFAGRGARLRQSAPWPHSCWYSPSGQWLLACDLGLDRVSIYDTASTVAALYPGPMAYAQVSSGAGARHMAIRTDGRFAYIANELDGTISVFALDETTGTLTIVQTIPCATEANQPCEIVSDAAGRFLYVTMRGPEAIGVFTIDADTGRLSPRQITSCLGRTPRHFALSPDGRLALVCNQLSDEVVGFSVADDGTLAPNGLRLQVPSPACAVFFE